MILLLCFLISSLVSSQNIPTVKETIHLSADSVEHRRAEDFYKADGSVTMRQGPITISSDHLLLDNKVGRLNLSGRVRYSDGENFLTADEVEMDLVTYKGRVLRGELFLKERNYHISGDVMERLSREEYRITGGSFTTCDCEQGEAPSWSFRARRINLWLENYLVARDTVFSIRGVPLLYLPYLIYPVTKPRQSGLLLPRIGYSTREGMRISPAFFWAITRSQDVTLSLDYRSSQGTGGELEYRYLLRRASGGILTAHFFRDRDQRKQTTDLALSHRFASLLGFVGRADLRYIDQTQLFRSLSEITEERSLIGVESHILLFRQRGASLFSFLGRYTQDLFSSGHQIPQRLPEIGYDLVEYRPFSLPLFFSLEARATNFFREEGIRAQRMDLYPTVAARLTLTRSVLLTPRVGFRETVYRFDGTTTSPGRRFFSRELMTVHVPLSQRFRFTYGGIGHIFEPQITYEYVPDVKQAEIPETEVFDEIDRLPSKNLMTYVLANRFQGAQKVSVVVSQSYHIRRVSPLLRSQFSDLRGELAFNASPLFSFRIDPFYNLSDGRLSSLNSDVAIQIRGIGRFVMGQRYTAKGAIPPTGDIFNPSSLGLDPFSLGGRIGREDRILFLTGQAVLNLPWGLALAGRTLYDMKTGRSAELSYGIRYISQCWGVTVNYVNLPEKDQVTFLITLQGVSAIGSRLFHDLFQF